MNTRIADQKPFNQDEFNVQLLLIVQDIFQAVSKDMIPFKAKEINNKLSGLLVDLENEHYRQMAETEAAERKRYDI